MFLQRSALYAVLVPWRAAVPQCRFYELPLRPNGQGGLLGFFAAEHSALPAGYDPHAYFKFLCFFCIGILMFFRFVFRAPKLLPRLFARLFCFSAGYIAVVELYNLLFTAAGAVFLDISNWFLYLTGAWSAIAILTLLLVASKKFRPALLPSTPSL